MNISFDSSDDDGDRGGLFTPTRGRKKSLVPDFTPTPSHSMTTEESTPAKKVPNQNLRKEFMAQDDDNNSTSFFADSANTLPKLHNASWLGVDMSPIRIGQDDGNDKDNTLEERSNRQIFTNANNSNSDDVMKSTRKSSLNGYVRPRPPLLLHPRSTAAIHKYNSLGDSREKGDYDHNNERKQRRRLINPFQRKYWTFWSAQTSSQFEKDISSSYAMIEGPSRLKQSSSVVIQVRRGNVFVMGATAFVLFCVGLHDGFLAYISMRRGVTTSYPLAWTLPWIGPTQQSLLIFGAFCPKHFLLTSSPEYWRCLTSMVVPTSLIEWLLLVWVWTRYLPPCISSHHSWKLSWPIVYILSSLTGQLWMVAFQYLLVQGASQNSDSEFPALSGCAGWATAGVLCAMGIQSPIKRFPCFLSSILLVIIHQCQATGSVIGCAAAAFFGWAY